VVAENINTHPKKDYWKLQGAGVSKNKMLRKALVLGGGWGFNAKKPSMGT